MRVKRFINYNRLLPKTYMIPILFSIALLNGCFSDDITGKIEIDFYEADIPVDISLSYIIN